MLEKIICYLVNLTTQTNYFEKIIPYAKLLVDGNGKTSPKEYIGNGQMNDITIFDHVNGLAYFRSNGEQRIGYSNNNEVPCYDEFVIDIPIRLVGVVPKSKLSKDDAFSEERMVQSLIHEISVTRGLAKDMKAIEVKFLPTNITTDGNMIAQEEYKGQINTINLNFAYIAIDFTTLIRIKINCIESECQ